MNHTIEAPMELHPAVNADLLKNALIRDLVQAGAIQPDAIPELGNMSIEASSDADIYTQVANFFTSNGITLPENFDALARSTAERLSDRLEGNTLDNIAA